MSNHAWQLLSSFVLLTLFNHNMKLDVIECVIILDGKKSTIIVLNICIHIDLPLSCLHIFRSFGQKLRHSRSFPVTLNANLPCKLLHNDLSEILICKQGSVHLNRYAYASASGRIIIKSACPGCPETVMERLLSPLKTLNPETLTPH